MKSPNSESTKTAAAAPLASDYADTAKDLLTNIEGAKDTALKVGADLDSKLRSNIKKNPLAVLGAALGVGFLLGSRWARWIPRALTVVGGAVAAKEVLKKTGYLDEDKK